MIQVSLKSIPNTDSYTLLYTADNIFEVLHKETSNVYSVSNNFSSANSELSFLIEKNKKLEHEIFEIKQMISKLNFNGSIMVITISPRQDLLVENVVLSLMNVGTIISSAIKLRNV